MTCDLARAAIRLTVRIWQMAALGSIAVLGLGSIVGCNPGVPKPASLPPNPGVVLFVSVLPSQQTVQVGSAALFSARPSFPANYQWQRSADGGTTYVDIPGAIGDSYTLPSASLADDATIFRVVATASTFSGSANATGNLAVSSAPAVVFEDGEFATTGWAVAASSTPSGPSNVALSASSGGNPDGFFLLTHVMSAGPSRQLLFAASSSATYDPAAQGAIVSIDYNSDCLLMLPNPSNHSVQPTLLIEQGDRRFAASTRSSCQGGIWGSFFVERLAGLTAGDFVLLDGPACASQAACPDFSAGASPLRFGFTSTVDLLPGEPAADISYGIDNWQVKVWRH
jgi:hypothetical protein